MRKIITMLVVCLFALHISVAQTAPKKHAPVKSHHSKSDSELKSGIKEGWHGVKAAGLAVGHTSRRAAKSVGHGTKKIVKDVGHDVKK